MRFLAFYLIWIMLTLLLGLLSPVLLPSRRASTWLARLWNKFTMLLARHVAGMRVKLDGVENICSGAAVYASKHQSSLDTFALWLALDNPAFVLKKELLSIPFFGWFLARTDPIAIDRSAGVSAVEQISKQAKAKLGEGRNIVIFPQGTRQPVDAKPHYKSGGVSALYALGFPVVPVSLNTGTLWPKKGKKHCGTATVSFCAQIEGGLGKDVLMRRVIDGCESI